MRDGTIDQVIETKGQSEEARERRSERERERDGQLFVQ